MALMVRAVEAVDFIRWMDVGSAALWIDWKETAQVSVQLSASWRARIIHCRLVLLALARRSSAASPGAKSARTTHLCLC